MCVGGKLQRAQQVAAACRAACDLLKGAPKSSRDDPHFMDNYYKSSRLHFIGTWKARIEALADKTAGLHYQAQRSEKCYIFMAEPQV